MNEFIKYKVIDHIAWITMKRDPSNAFNIKFLDEILNTLKIASRDKYIRKKGCLLLINKIFKKFNCYLFLQIKSYLCQIFNQLIR